MNDEQKLKDEIDRQTKRKKKAEQEQHTLLAQTTYIGTLGLVFVLPVIAGAYLGNWLDSLVSGYSIRWTISLIFLGMVVGIINVYLLIRKGD